MEWQGSGPSTGECNDLVRCIPTGLESCVQWHQDRRPLVSGGTEIAHKLPGATGCNPGITILSEGSNERGCDPISGPVSDEAAFLGLSDILFECLQVTNFQCA